MKKKYRDCHLYYQVAREAVQLEKDGEYDRAAKVWMKAAGESINRANERWARIRSDFCFCQIVREKFRKEAEEKLLKRAARR
ncbi:ANR family transcriptional regulator [Salmonella enterica]|nr:ANR family transcriptional regulator [Salmonella enterica]EBQ2367378.1 ANR family transcriptional regulator [Salmonella enterica]EIA2855578.1 ANR family transcriptional regulator [Salmonella enterica]EIB0084450.1 ANR family transcriptional regulator [Salmonella enterica]